MLVETRMECDRAFTRGREKDIAIEQDKKTIQEMQISHQLTESELHQLRQRQDELVIQNEALTKDLRNYTGQMEALFKANKMLRTKIKQSDHLLYGRTIS